MSTKKKARKGARKASKTTGRGTAKSPVDPAGKIRYGKSIEKNEWLLIGSLFFFAIAIRIVYFLISKGRNPLFYHPILDPLFHDKWAKDIISGNFWGDEVFFRAPLYAYFLALLYKISSSSIAFAIFCQHILGSLSVVLIYLLARMYFPLKVALAAGILASLYWPLIYFEGDLLIVTFFIFLLLVFLFLLDLSLRTTRRFFLLASGILFGLAAITRPTILVLIPVVPIVIYLRTLRSASNAGKRVWMNKSIIVFVGFILVLLPVIVRNYVIGRDIVPIASQGGVNFYIGNNPQSNGSRAVVPGAPGTMSGTFRGAIDLAEGDVGRAMRPSEVSNYYFKKGFKFIFSSPAGALSLTVKKFYLFWAGVERSNNKYIDFFWRNFGLGRIPLPGFWFVGPMGLLGGILLWSRRRELSILYLFVLSYMIGVVMFFVNARFRLPVAPVLIIFSSYALVYVYHAFRLKSIYLVKALLVLLIFEIFVNYDFVAFRGVRAADEIITHYELGKALFDMNRKEEALEEFERAHAINERYPTRAYKELGGSVDYFIGSLYWEKGLYSRAIDSLEKVRGDSSIVFQANTLLADSYLQKGKVRYAIGIYLSNLKKAPGNFRNQLGLARAYKIIGEEKLLSTSEQILRALCQNPHAYNNKVFFELAGVLEKEKKLDEAINYYLAAANDLGLRKDAYLKIAWIYKRTGQNDKVSEYISIIKANYPYDRVLYEELRALDPGLSKKKK